jgi:alcohol dehydrogenase YqhD (iron-dependent ADH family)
MENFTSYNPTKVLFGKGVVSKLGKEAVKYGDKALILIGKGSVKKNGILQAVENQLDTMGISHTLYEGIKSNPIYQDCDKAVAQAQEFGAEMIIAVGGGSVLDSAKAIAVGFYANHSVWDFYAGKAERPGSALPIISVLTLAATGSEMNCFTVIQNDELKIKGSYGNALLYPKASFLDPEYTYSVSAAYTAYGVVDLISHCLEAYFDLSNSPLSDYMVSDIIKLAMEHGKKAVNEPQNYDARANVMWLATMALNGSLDAGKRGGDWGVHGLEHTLSALYDIPHGAGLAVVYPAWLKYHQPQIAQKLDFLAERILGIGKKGEDFIQALESFFAEIGAPTRLSQVKISTYQHTEIINNFIKTRASGQFFKLSEANYQSIVDLMA